MVTMSEDRRRREEKESQIGTLSSGYGLRSSSKGKELEGENCHYCGSYSYSLNRDGACSSCRGKV